jgi:TonB family protein
VPFQTYALAAAVLLALALPIDVHAQDAVLPPGAAPPDWLAKPPAAAMATYYPELANDLDLGGFAEINCRVSAYGIVERCRVVSATPPGLGFGRAALRLAPLFRFRPATTLVTAVPSQVMIPVRFVPPPDDIRRAIPFMALLAALSTLWAPRGRRLRGTKVSLQAKPGQIAGG